MLIKTSDVIENIKQIRENVGQEEWNSCNTKGVDLDILVIGSSAMGKSNLKLYDKGTGGNK